MLHCVHNMYSVYPAGQPIDTDMFSVAFHNYLIATHRLRMSAAERSKGISKSKRRLLQRAIGFVEGWGQTEAVTWAASGNQLSCHAAVLAGNNLSRTCAANPNLRKAVQDLLRAISHPVPAIANDAAQQLIGLAEQLGGSKTRARRTATRSPSKEPQLGQASGADSSQQVAAAPRQQVQQLEDGMQAMQVLTPAHTTGQPAPAPPLQAQPQLPAVVDGTTVQQILQQVVHQLTNAQPSALLATQQQASTSQTQQEASVGSISAATAGGGRAPPNPVRQVSTRQRRAPGRYQDYDVEGLSTSKYALLVHQHAPAVAWWLPLEHSRASSLT
jgi:hypothetical protein